MNNVICGYNQEGNNLNCDGAHRYPKGYIHTSPDKFYTLSGINKRIFTMEKKIIENIFSKFHNAFSKWQTFIGLSFLPENMRQNFIKIIAGRLKLLG